MPNIDMVVQFMIETANDNTHGYDQTNRYSPDYDCSSLVAIGLHNAGFNVSPYSWTGNLEKQLRACGFVDCKAPWKAGDIHLKTGKHVVMSINENEIVHATINENGTIKGGTTGDQTGKEICVAPYYDYNGGWDVHLRYIENTSNTAVDLDSVALDVIRGKYGNGETRKLLLKEAGFNYVTVQTRVNQLMQGGSHHTTKTNEEIALEVIRGVWGNGDERKHRLAQAGYDYTIIQKIVNEKMKQESKL